MIMISDTTPIISLLKADQLGLLEKLYGNVLMPRAVYRELTENPDTGLSGRRPGMAYVRDRIQTLAGSWDQCENLLR